MENILLILFAMTFLSASYFFWELKRVLRIVNKNAKSFNDFAEQNEKELQAIRNNLIPLYVMKRERDLVKAIKNEEYELIEQYQQEIANLKLYCKENNCPL